MKKITILSTTSILETYNYKITSNDFNYIALLNIYSPIKSIIKSRRAFLSKISVINEDKKEIMNIYKNYQSPITKNLFVIEIDNDTYFVKESNNFKIPDLYINTPFGLVEISGNIASGEFLILLNSTTIAIIKTTKRNNNKEYEIFYFTEDDLLIKLIISSTLILDNLYHYY